MDDARPLWILVGPEACLAPAARESPRLDYRVLAELAGATVHHGQLAPALLTGPKPIRLVRSLGDNLVKALRWAQAAPRGAIIFSTGETWGVPFAVAAALVGRQDLLHVMYCHRVYSAFWLRLLHLLERTSGVHGFICVTEQQAVILRNALHLGPERVTAIPQGVDTLFFTPRCAVDAPDRGYILSVGSEMRNYPMFFAAVATLPVHVLVKTGSTWMSRPRRNLPSAPNNVRLISERVSYASLRDLYAHAKIVVAPLEDTCQAAGITTILEAMAMGKCVVATRSNGLPDVLVHGRTGLIVENSAEALREGIAACLANEGYSGGMAQAASAEVLRSYSLESYAGRVVGFLFSLAESTAVAHKQQQVTPTAT